jgi:hypothetical protein
VVAPCAGSSVAYREAVERHEAKAAVRSVFDLRLAHVRK